MRALLLLAVLLAPAPAFAQMYTDPVSNAGNGRSRAFGVFSASEIDYEGKHQSDAEIERKVLGLEIDYGFDPTIDFVGQAGFIMKTEVEDIDEDGNGFTFGGGLRVLVHREQKLNVSAYGMFTYQSEEIDGDDWKYEIETYDFHLGSMVGFMLAPKAMPYVGLDLVAYDDGEAKFKPDGGSSTKADIERDDILNMKLGILAFVNTMILRGEVTLLGEQTFTIAAGTTF